jgi:hypothetical protein
VKAARRALLVRRTGVVYWIAIIGVGLWLVFVVSLGVNAWYGEDMLTPWTIIAA